MRINSDKAHVAGGELETGVAYGSVWDFNIGATFEKAQCEEPDPDFNSKDIFRTPNIYGFAETGVRPFKGFEIATNLELTGPMKVPHYEGAVTEPVLEESPWFADWSANVSYKIRLKEDTYVKPFAGIKNILNALQDDFDEGAGRDAGYVYGPRLPRTVFVGVKGGM